MLIEAFCRKEPKKNNPLTIELVLFPSFCRLSVFLSVFCNLNVHLKLPKRLSKKGNYIQRFKHIYI